MKKLKIILALAISFAMAVPATAQIGNLKNLKDKVPSTKKVPDIKKEKPSKEQVIEMKSEATEVMEVTEVAEVKTESILFSSSPINPENPENLTKDFKTGEHIYAIALLPDVINEYYPYEGPTKAVTTEVFLYTVQPPFYAHQKEDREEQLSHTNLVISGSLRANNYLMIEIAPNPELTNVYANSEMKFREFGKKWNGPAQLAQDIATLKSGKNKIKVVVHMNYNPVASGTFEISGDDFKFYAGLSDQLNELAAEGGAASAQFPKAKKSDPALEKRMIAEFTNSNHFKSGRFDAEEILKIAIYDEDWHIRRHEISGIVTQRYIRAAIAVKGKDGKCGYYNVTFKEDHVGGKYEPMKYDGAADRYAIKCENLK